MNRAPILAVLLVALTATGCRSTPEKNAASRDENDMRANCYSLLFNLLEDEKDVKKLLLIKKTRPEVKQLIDRISTTAAAGAGEVKKLAQEDPSLCLKCLELPAGEAATRKSIAKLRAKQLLFSAGENFEFTLLLTQTEATAYGWQLAKVTADAESRPAARRAVEALSGQLKELNDQTVSLLRSCGSSGAGK